MSENRKRIVIKKRSKFPRKIYNKIMRNWLFIVIVLGGLLVGLCIALAITGNLNIGLPSFGSSEASDR